MQNKNDTRAVASPEMLRHLAAASDLPLSPERMETLTPEVQGLLDRVNALYTIDVRDAQPSPPFKDEIWG